MVAVGVAQGLPANGFEVLDWRGQPAVDRYVCHDTADAVRGVLVYLDSATGKLKVAQAGQALELKDYVGFLDTNVVSDMATRVQHVYGDYAQVDEDFVNVWQVGRFYVTAVNGTVADNALVYPADNGKLSATQSDDGGSPAIKDPAIGIARKGNNSVAGGAIEVEINLFGAL